MDFFKITLSAFLLHTYKMLKIQSLHHIQICIPTGKENDAREFYTDILGLVEIHKPVELIPNGGLWYKVGDIEFHIGTENETNNSKRHPGFEVTDIEEAKKHLSVHNINFKEEKTIPGQIRISFSDPFNNKIELLQKI